MSRLSSSWVQGRLCMFLLDLGVVWQEEYSETSSESEGDLAFLPMFEFELQSQVANRFNSSLSAWCIAWNTVYSIGHAPLNQIINYLAPMAFTRFVEVGRVARVNYGPLEGKLAVIVDIINENRVLIDGAGIKRQPIPIRRLRLTGHTLKIGRGARAGSIKKALETEQLQAKWDNSALGKKIKSQQRRANLNDFERFKATILRKRLSKLLRIRPKNAVSAPKDKKPTDKPAKVSKK